MGDTTDGLSAERQILNLIHRYAELVDAGDFDALGEMFGAARYGMVGGPMARGAEVAGAMRDFVQLHEGSPRTKHITTNTMLEIDGGCATARSYFTVLQAVDHLALQPILAGRYADEFARHDGSWHFTSREISIDLAGDLSQHARRAGRS
jgi:3-phenylpropionate/cinnamic acid dioxygenase small subunit